jgi:hypothetical protein
MDATDRPARAAHIAACTGLVQGIYYVAIGLWPLLGPASYIGATGPKPDLWSLHATAILLVAVGLAVALASVRRRLHAELRLLALAVPLGLLVIDVAHVVAGRVVPVYLVDALAQLLFAAAWSWPWLMALQGLAPGRAAVRAPAGGVVPPEVGGAPAPQH